MAATSVALGVLLNAVPPARYRIPASLAACAAVSGLAARSGAGIEDQGLSAGYVRRGCIYGLAAAVPIAGALTAGLFLAPSRPFYTTDRIAGAAAGARYEILVRIPIGTALAEEVIFRGALLAVLARHHRDFVATALSSLLFGLWHIAPALDQIESRTERPAFKQKVAFVAGSVAVTSAAGLVLAWLRRRSGSIVAPWLAHATANATGFAAVRLAARLDRGASGLRARGSSARCVENPATTR